MVLIIYLRKFSLKPPPWFWSLNTRALIWRWRSVSITWFSISWISLIAPWMWTRTIGWISTCSRSLWTLSTHDRSESANLSKCFIYAKFWTCKWLVVLRDKNHEARILKHATSSRIRIYRSFRNTQWKENRESIINSQSVEMLNPLKNMTNSWRVHVFISTNVI